MTSKKLYGLLLVAVLTLVLSLALPTLVQAGGWAVVTLDEMPQNVIAGQPYPLGMMGRQHGITPMTVDKLTIEAHHADTGEKLTFTAKPDQQPGHYQVELLFPISGVWEWSVSTGLMPLNQPFPSIEVADAPATASLSPANGLAGFISGIAFPQFLLGMLAILAFTTGLTLILRSHNMRPRLLYGALMVVVCGGLVFALFSTVQAKDRQGAAIPSVLVDSDTGQQLFLAKGCVVCHVNDRAIQDSKAYSLDVGPNLTDYHNDPGYLRQWLADPQSIRSTATMPNLGLSAAEIEALVQFINGGDKQ